MLPLLHALIIELGLLSKFQGNKVAPQVAPKTVPSPFTLPELPRSLRQAKLLYQEVSGCDDLELLCAEPQLSIVPFRHVPPSVDDLDAHNLRLVAALQETGDVWVAPARVDRTVCLRPCIVNYRTTDDDVRALVTLARDAGRTLAASV